MDAWDRDEVRILVEKWADVLTEAEARAAFADLQVFIQPSGKDVSVRADSKSDRRFKSLDLKVRLTVPRPYHANVSTAGGGIAVGNLEGNVTAKTAGGSIKIGPSEGEIVASTAGGSIRVEGSGGPVKVETSGGSIRIAAARGYIEAATSGGSIDAELIVSDKATDTHCTLETSGGDVTIRLPAGLAATVSADLTIKRRVSRDYRIYFDFPLTIKGEGTDRITAQGEINGGGGLIRLTTVNGDIHIKKLEK